MKPLHPNASHLRLAACGSFRLVALLIVVLSIVCFAAIAPNAAVPACQAAASTVDTSVSPKIWARSAAEKEVAIILHPNSCIRYKQHVIDAKGNDVRDELRDVIESKDGPVGRLIMRDNRALTPDEDRAEHDRLSGLIDHPSDFVRHVKSDAGSKKTAVEMIRMMPDAMVFTYAVDQTPSPSSNAAQVVLDYVPDPKFNPPTTASQALTGLRGRIWIDTKSKTIVRITGEIFQPVNFGFGILAHVYPGGTLDIEQTAAAGDRWNMTVFHEHVTVKALMVKMIKVNSEVRSFDFRPSSNELRYQDAIHILLDTPLPK